MAGNGKWQTREKIPAVLKEAETEPTVVAVTRRHRSEPVNNFETLAS